LKPEELETLLNKEPLLDALDVKTLVLDRIKQMEPKELLPLFESFLPELEAEKVQGYLYIRRG
jgi:hypothetical protein